jgi:hypothetical protein
LLRNAHRLAGRIALLMRREGSWMWLIDGLLEALSFSQVCLFLYQCCTSGHTTDDELYRTIAFLTFLGSLFYIAVAGVVSIYSVWDMLRYNRARRAEWAEAQKKLEADSLATARLAYLKGEATPEQTVLVEEANRKAEESGVKLPPLISPPEHRTHFEEHFKPALQGDSKATDNGEGKGVFGALTGLFASGEQKAERAANAAANKTEEEAQAIGTSVRGAWEHEKENQRRGGTLDQLGLETAGASQAAPKKKGWWPW